MGFVLGVPYALVGYLIERFLPKIARPENFTFSSYSNPQFHKINRIKSISRFIYNSAGLRYSLAYQDVTLPCMVILNLLRHQDWRY